MDVYFIKSAEGFYSGHAEGGKVFFIPERKGAVVFRSERSAQDRIDELKIDAEVVGY